MSLPAQYDDLTRLARAINDSHKAARELAGKSREKLAEAVAEAALAGQKLCMVKRILAHGEFLPWLKKHCPNIKERTARNYMALANRKHIADLETADSLRQAYILCGIIKEPESNPDASPQPLFRLPALARITKAKPPEQWEAGEREIFKTWFDENVTPLIAIRAKLN